MPKKEVLREVLTEICLKWIRAPVDFPMSLGNVVQEESLFTAIPSSSLWQQEPLGNKLKCLFARSWEPKEDLLQVAALGILQREVFGSEDDFGPELMKVVHERFSRERSNPNLSDMDRKRASALRVLTATTYLRLGQIEDSNPPLNLGLGLRSWMLASLVFPMELKIPVVSLKWFLDIDFTAAVSKIRASGHPQADAIIAFLYEIIFLQHKTAIAIHEYLRLAAYAVENKGQAAMINAEVNAMMQADLVFTYLKATVEKSMALLGLTYAVVDLEDRRTHAKRIKALETAIPQKALNTHYGSFVLEMLKSENLDDLNRYRSGILHKRGIADLQPHNYVDVDPLDAPFEKILTVLIEQHSQNTAVLLGVMALLTDSLMDLERPDEEEMQWFFEHISPISERSIQKRKPQIERELEGIGATTEDKDGKSEMDS